METKEKGEKKVEGKNKRLKLDKCERKDWG